MGSSASFAFAVISACCLAIAHLRGGGAFATSWTTDDQGLTRAERRELQSLLLTHGHNTGEIDGLLGETTRNVVRAEQTRLGWAADGRTGKKLLKALRMG